jgi:hypothetical protein
MFKHTVAAEQERFKYQRNKETEYLSITKAEINATKLTDYKKYSNLQSIKSKITITHVMKAQDLMTMNTLVNDVNTHTVRDL